MATGGEFEVARADGTRPPRRDDRQAEGVTNAIVSRCGTARGHKRWWEKGRAQAGETRTTPDAAAFRHRQENQRLQREGREGEAAQNWRPADAAGKAHLRVSTAVTASAA